MTDINDQADNENLDDMWAAAMSESAEISAEKKDDPAKQDENASSVFKPLASTSSSAVESRELEMIKDIPVSLSVELGRTRITIKQLLEMAQGSVIDLDGMAGDPMNIFINNHLVASGEVVVIDNKYGIRITEIVTPSERIQKLNRK